MRKHIGVPMSAVNLMGSVRPEIGRVSVKILPIVMVQFQERIVSELNPTESILLSFHFSGLHGIEDAQVLHPAFTI